MAVGDGITAPTSLAEEGCVAGRVGLSLTGLLSGADTTLGESGRGGVVCSRSNASSSTLGQLLVVETTSNLELVTRLPRPIGSNTCRNGITGLTNNLLFRINRHHIWRWI